MVWILGLALTLTLAATTATARRSVASGDVKALLESEFFQAQSRKKPLDFPEDQTKGVALDVFVTPERQLLVKAELSGKTNFFQLDINAESSIRPKNKVNSQAATSNSTQVSADSGVDAKALDPWVTAANGVNFWVDVDQYREVVDQDEEELIPSLEISGVIGLAPTNNSFAALLAQNGQTDSPVARLFISNQFSDYRSQLLIGPLPDRFTEPRTRVVWSNTTGDTWSVIADWVAMRSAETGTTRLSFDFSRPGVILNQKLYAIFLQNMHENGFVCRGESDSLRCFSRYLFRSAKFPNIEFGFVTPAENRTVTLLGDFLIFNADRELQDGIYRLDVSVGPQSGVVIGSCFLNQFTVFLDPKSRRLGMLETGVQSYYFFRNYRVQVYLNRIIFIVLLAFVISAFVTKVMRVNEEGMAGFDFFSPQVFE